MKTLKIQDEGVRIPVWISTLLIFVIINPAIALLGNVDFKIVLINLLISVSAMISTGEIARRNVYSQTSFDDQISE